MQVKLLTAEDQLSSMEHNAAYAMLVCHANTDKLKGIMPCLFLQKAIQEEHESVLEHITLTYEVNNLTRACLQELARHRHISLSVESTRHTLKKLLLDEDFILETPDLNYDVEQDDENITPASEMVLLLMQLAHNKKITNDELKYYVPEFWPTNLILTANVRELRHIVSIRTSPAAFKEFQELARNFVSVLPERFKYLFEDCE